MFQSCLIRLCSIMDAMDLKNYEKLDFVYFVFNLRRWNCFRSFARCLIKGDGEFVSHFILVQKKECRTYLYPQVGRALHFSAGKHILCLPHFKSNAQNDGFRPLLQTPCFPLRPQQSTRDAQEFGALRNHTAKGIPTGRWEVGNLATLFITKTILPLNNPYLGTFKNWDTYNNSPFGKLYYCAMRTPWGNFLYQ
jgi:hypothetical protein